MSGWPEDKGRPFKPGQGVNGHDGVYVERRVALKEITGKDLNKQERIFKRDEFACLKCGSKQELTLDHVKPKAAWGTSDESNLQTLCATCNGEKGHHFNDYRKARAYPEDGDSPLRSEL